MSLNNSSVRLSEFKIQLNIKKASLDWSKSSTIRLRPVALFLPPKNHLPISLVVFLYHSFFFIRNFRYSSELRIKGYFQTYVCIISQSSKRFQHLISLKLCCVIFLASAMYLNELLQELEVEIMFLFLFEHPSNHSLLAGVFINMIFKFAIH